MRRTVVWPSALRPAKTNAALDKLEDPEQLLDEKYRQLLTEQQRIARAVRDSIADRNLIQGELAELQGQAKKVNERAKLYRLKALSLEGQAATAELPQQSEQIEKYNQEAIRLLKQRLRLDERVRALQDNLERAGLRVKAIKEKQIDLKAKLDDLRLKKEELKSEWRLSKAEERISGALAGLEGDFSDVDLTLQRIEEKVKRKKALAQASSEVLAGQAEHEPVIEIAGEPELRAEVALQDLDRELLGGDQTRSLDAGPQAGSHLLVAVSGGGTWAFPAELRDQILNSLNRVDEQLNDLVKEGQLSPEEFAVLYRQIFQVVRERGQLVGRDISLSAVSGEQGYPKPEITLPPEDLEYDEALKLLKGEGLIPG